MDDPEEYMEYLAQQGYVDNRCHGCDRAIAIPETAWQKSGENRFSARVICPHCNRVCTFTSEKV